ncbi:MAG TPA: DUF357 domain-containing protein [Thermoplasmata archaeon]|jgi:hypothetical protein|nr:DUF357 domain-containing protein [Thermoplasmata archaeon]
MPAEGAVLSAERVEKYIALTSEALSKLSVAAPERSFNRKLAEDFLQMARSYFDDAKDFARKGDLVNAFACVNYAHGWLDSGARIGLFEVGCDDRLFTLYE